MGYCRKHHIDLVHITTRDVQERVAEKARNATSPHVWLGLRYTCSFNFWFWISSGTNCYLNWAPGQGPEGKYDCGATGAIQATGGQQWVGLPETEKLNFICSSCVGWELRVHDTSDDRVLKCVLVIQALLFHDEIFCRDCLLLITVTSSFNWDITVDFNAYLWRHLSTFVEIQLSPLLLRVNFIIWKKPHVVRVGVHIHSHGQQE